MLLQIVAKGARLVAREVVVVACLHVRTVQGSAASDSLVVASLDEISGLLPPGNEVRPALTLSFVVVLVISILKHLLY